MRGRLRRACARTLAFFVRRAHERDLDAELATHVALAVDDLVARGVDPPEARRRARASLGGVESAREQHREARGLPFLDTLGQDGRYAFRTLRRDRAFATIAVLILGIGIGANTAIFSLVNAVLIRPLPFRNPDQLVWVAYRHTTTVAPGLSTLSATSPRVAILEQWQQRSRSFEAFTAFNAFFAYGSPKLTSGGEPERIVGVEVAENFFGVLGIVPQRGRAFTAEEARPNARAVAMISHALWQRRFAGSPDIVGRPITVDDRPVTVVGVLPPTFDFGTVFAPGRRVDLFTPLIADIVRNWGNTLGVVARLKPGVTVADAQAEIDVVQSRIAHDRPDLWMPPEASVTALGDHVNGRMRRAVLVLWGAVALVLLIVCANLSNLTMTRAAARQKEMAVRAALGANRRRLLRQILTENLVISACGAALGVAIAVVVVQWIAGIQALSVPLLRYVRIDAAVLAFTIVVTVLTGLLVGVTPALQGASPRLQHVLKDSTRSSTSGRSARVRAVLVVCQTALACTLLVAAGLLMRSFVRVLDVDLGFRPDRAVALKMEASPARATTDDQRYAFFDEVTRRVLAVPGVEAVGLTDTLPYDRNRHWFLRVKGQTYPPGTQPVVAVRRIGPGYFVAAGIPLRIGRDFSNRDTRATPRVVILNETTAQELWPGQNPLGRIVVTVGGDHQVVGVVGDVRHSSPEEGAGLEMYLPFRQAGTNTVDVVIRSSVPLPALAPAVRNALQSLDPSLPLSDFRPLRDFVDRAVSPRRFLASLVSVFAIVALVLACLGIYGVISYSVNERTQEIGIRIALGASRADVEWGVLRQTLTLASLGLAIGTAGALSAGRLMESLLFDVTTTDPATFAAMIAVLTIIAALAGYLPARKAATIDPIVALR